MSAVFEAAKERVHARHGCVRRDGLQAERLDHAALLAAREDEGKHPRLVTRWRSESRRHGQTSNSQGVSDTLEIGSCIPFSLPDPSEGNHAMHETG